MTHLDNRPTLGTDRAPEPPNDPMAREEAAALRALYVVSRDGLVVADRVGVALAAGVATLRGTVDSDGQRRAAEAYVRLFQPVIEVSNHIRVRA